MIHFVNMIKLLNLIDTLSKCYVYHGTAVYNSVDHG